MAAGRNWYQVAQFVMYPSAQDDNYDLHYVYRMIEMMPFWLAHPAHRIAYLPDELGRSRSFGRSLSAVWSTALPFLRKAPPFRRLTN